MSGVEELREVMALLDKADAAKAHADAPLEQAQWSRTCFANAARMDAERAALAWVRTHGPGFLQRLEAAEKNAREAEDRLTRFAALDAARVGGE